MKTLETQSGHSALPKDDGSVIGIQDDLDLIKNYLTPAFMKKYTVLEAYRITENNFSTKKEVRYLPVYAVFCLNDLKIQEDL